MDQNDWQDDEAYIVIKAAPVASKSNTETVCCAGITIHGQWRRLYPVNFRMLEREKQFSRWEKINFRSKRPFNDKRPESRKIDHESIVVNGKLDGNIKEKLISSMIVQSTDKELSEGRSLCFLDVEMIDFIAKKRTVEEFQKEKSKFENMRKQMEMFPGPISLPYSPCPWKFQIRYRTDDGIREGTCQDWETEATFFNWRKSYDEKKVIESMKKKFGEEIPEEGMLLAMGTHSLYPATWLINGIIQHRRTKQIALL